MESDGDPEARIRELERPLAQQALASELGTRPDDAGPQPRTDPRQPALQPYSGPWESPYYAPPQYVVRKRTGLLWLVPLLIVGVVTIGVVAVIGYFTTGHSGSGSSVPAPPTIAGGGAVLDPPRGDPQQPRTATPEPVTTVAAGQSTSVSGFDGDRSVVCSGGTVNVSGMRNTVDITGDCAAVTVSGFDNVVTVEFADLISASGFDNRVTYAFGEPRINNTGGGNVVEAG